MQFAVVSIRRSYKVAHFGIRHPKASIQPVAARAGVPTAVYSLPSAVGSAKDNSKVGGVGKCHRRCQRHLKMLLVQQCENHRSPSACSIAEQDSTLPVVQGVLHLAVGADAHQVGCEEKVAFVNLAEVDS